MPGEEPRFAWGGRSTPLDAYAPEASRDEAAEALRPGTMILLYSDGLVEQRSRPLKVGMELLRNEVAAHAAGAVPAILDGLIRVASDLEHPDDVCMLGARLS